MAKRNKIGLVGAGMIGIYPNLHQLRDLIRFIRAAMSMTFWKDQTL